MEIFLKPQEPANAVGFHSLSLLVLELEELSANSSFFFFLRVCRCLWLLFLAQALSPELCVSVRTSECKMLLDMPHYEGFSFVSNYHVGYASMPLTGLRVDRSVFLQFSLARC